MANARPHYFFDLFAGCGGLSTGLEAEGFEPLLVSELNKDALNSYLVNRETPNAEGFALAEQPDLQFMDVYELTSDRIEAIKGFVQEKITDIELPAQGDSTLDLICGGPPCQGFSGIGHRRSYSVDKKDLPSNQLYEKMAEIIEQVRPRIFLFENVKGLLSSKWTSEGHKGEIWEDVKARFEQIEGYCVRWNLVRAKDYGVPQNRPRVLLVGIRQDVVLSAGLDPDAHPDDAVKCGFLPQPTGGAPDPEELLSDLVDPSVGKALLAGDFPKEFKTDVYLSEPKNEIQKSLRTKPDGSVLARGDEVTDQEYSKHSPKIVAKFKHMLENDGEIPLEMKTKKFAQRLIPKKWSEAGPSITATSLPDDYVHFGQPRSLTVREWARLQMFPDWYKFAGKRTTGGLRRAGNPREGVFDREVPKYTQIGNAVPVKLAQVVGAHFSMILNK